MTFREELLEITMKSRDLSKEQAECVLDRLAYRLDDHTHVEAIEKYPHSDWCEEHQAWNCIEEST